MHIALTHPQSVSRSKSYFVFMCLATAHVRHKSLLKQKNSPSRHLLLTAPRDSIFLIFYSVPPVLFLLVPHRSCQMEGEEGICPRTLFWAEDPSAVKSPHTQTFWCSYFGAVFPPYTSPLACLLFNTCCPCNYPLFQDWHAINAWKMNYVIYPKNKLCYVSDIPQMDGYAQISKKAQLQF